MRCSSATVLAIDHGAHASRNSLTSAATTEGRKVSSEADVIIDAD